MKNMDTLEEPHLSALLATATYLPLTVGMTEPTLPGRYTYMSSSRIAVQCRQTGRLYPIGPTMDFLRHWPVQQLSTFIACPDR